MRTLLPAPLVNAPPLPGASAQAAPPGIRPAPKVGHGDDDDGWNRCVDAVDDAVRKTLQSAAPVRFIQHLETTRIPDDQVHGPPETIEKAVPEVRLNGFVVVEGSLKISLRRLRDKNRQFRVLDPTRSRTV